MDSMIILPEGTNGTWKTMDSMTILPEGTERHLENKGQMPTIPMARMRIVFLFAAKHAYHDLGS
jgi:hypothetical protein